MAKPHLTIITENPLTASINKKGRAVSESTALAVLRKRFPWVPEASWKITKGSKTTRAEVIPPPEPAYA